MKYEDLTPEQKKNIEDLARIGRCGDLLAEIAFDSGISPEICSALVIGVANQKLAKMKGDPTLIEVVG